MGFIVRIKKKLIGIPWKRKIEYLINNGAEIGKNIAWYDTNSIFVDETRPWLLHIGNYTKITRGVVILTHDYSLSVLRRVYKEWIGEGKETYIGDNCFLGMNSIILMGSHIGDNCIVGAGSVVHGNFPNNVVIAGNPGRVICTLQEHYENRSKKTIDEAKDCASIFRKRLGREPTPKDLANFKFLFTPRTIDALKEYEVDSFFCNGDEPQEVKEAFFNSKPYWDTFEDFIAETN